jgi:hypothetical protein
MVKPIGCLTCRERIAWRRGCCTACYDRHGRAVRQGKTIWADLETRGLAAPAQLLDRKWLKGLS